MKARDVERKFVASGIGRAKMDLVMRGLREKEIVPTGGRGASAPNIDPRVAAQIMIATAGSSKGSTAHERLDLLSKLKCQNGDNLTLLDRFESLLADEDEAARVARVTIGRNVRTASIDYLDGRIEQFSTEKAKDYKFRVQVAATIPGALVQRISRSLNLKVPEDEYIEIVEEPDDD